MKDIRFYQEFENKSKTKPTGNVIAMLTPREHRCPDGSQEAMGSVFFYPDSPVASTSVSRDYLTAKCKRIPESKARLIHPRLFERLDAPE